MSEEKNPLPFTTIVRDYKTGIKSPPTVLCEPESIDDMLALPVPPATVIVYVGDDGVCRSRSGNAVFGSMEDVCRKVSGKLLLALYAASEAAADRVISFCREEGVSDIFIVSDNAELVKKVREALPLVRGMIDYRSLTEIKEPYSIVAATNSHHAKVALINGSIAARPLLRYLQQRMITVFLYDDSQSETDLHSIIQYGPNGIVTPDPDRIRVAYERYREDYTAVRHPFVIGHRGIPDQAPENTIPSYRLAVEKGAENIETDIQTTKDVQLVIMHDESLGRTVEGEGRLYLYTLDELTSKTADKAWKGTDFEGTKIPSFEEFLQFGKTTDCVLFVEIKEIHPQIVDKFIELVDKYDMRRQICVISFFKEVLQEVHAKLPEMSLGFLWLIVDPDKDVMEECHRHIDLAVANFACMDLNINRANQAYYDNISHRGVTAWPWTYENPPGADNFFKEYFYMMGGMTTNNCEWASRHPVDLSADKSVYSVMNGETIEIGGVLTNRLKEKSSADCEICVVEGAEHISVSGRAVTGVTPGKASVMLKKSLPFGQYTMTIYSVPVEVLVG